MNNYMLLLSLSYISLALFVVWVAFGKRFSGKQKIFISLILPFIYYLHWQGLQETKGWPNDQTIPAPFELISADIVEPNPLEGIDGRINLWIRPEDNGLPRAYTLSYSRDLHQRLFETREKIAQGHRQIGLLYDSSSGQGGASIGGGMKLAFKNAPRMLLPPKK